MWVEGNHDQGLSQIMSHLVGVPVYQRYVWEYQGKRHLAVHGHQFHPFCRKNEFLSRVGERIFYELQKMDGNRKRISRFIDRTNTRWLRMQSIVAEGAFLYARAGHVDRIFCGHTHVATHQNRNGIDYYNSGSWIDANPTYLTIGEQGVEIRVYEGEKYDYAETSQSEAELVASGRSVLRPGIRKLREHALLGLGAAGVVRESSEFADDDLRLNWFGEYLYIRANSLPPIGEQIFEASISGSQEDPAMREVFAQFCSQR